MGAASLSELKEGLTGRPGLSPEARDLMNLGGLGMMAAPSISAARHLAQRGAKRKGVAGGGSKLTNAVNIAGLAALGAPILDRMQARFRGRPEEGRFLSDRQSALLELAGYGGLASNLIRAKAALPVGHAEHKGLNQQLLGYGILAAPEVGHAIHDPHPEYPDYDAYGNPIPKKPSALRAATDLVGLSLLGKPVLDHMKHASFREAIYAGYVEEMNKLAEVDAEEFERAVNRLEKMEKEKPDPTQLKRYAAIGAVLSPVASAAEKLVTGDPLLARNEAGKVMRMKTFRNHLGKSVGGAIGAGVIPVVRHHLDRAAERRSLQRKIEELEAPSVEKEAARLIPTATGSPRSRLSSSQRIGQPKVSVPEGPSVADIAKPNGFGLPQPGATKGF